MSTACGLLDRRISRADTDMVSLRNGRTRVTFDITFFAVAVPAVILTGISKGGFAGMGSMAVPILSLVMLPTTATALMLPILCLMDVIALWTYWGKWHALNMRILVVAGVIGIAIGTVTFRYLHPEAIRILIGLIAVLFALRHWLRSAAATREPAQPSIAKGGFWGTVAGFTSFVSHAGAPPVAVYLLPQRLDKTVYQATTVTLFLAVNYAKIGPYYFLDLFTRESLLADLICDGSRVATAQTRDLRKRPCKCCRRRSSSRTSRTTRGLSRELHLSGFLAPLRPS